MSERDYVEKPFMDQLASLGWTVIDHGPGIPQVPAFSKRTDFKEVILKETFKQSVRSINLTEGGKEWLTDDQLNKLLDEVTQHTGKGLIEANHDVLKCYEQRISA